MQGRWVAFLGALLVGGAASAQPRWGADERRHLLGFLSNGQAAALVPLTPRRSVGEIDRALARRPGNLPLVPGRRSRTLARGVLTHYSNQHDRRSFYNHLQPAGRGWTFVESRLVRAASSGLSIAAPAGRKARPRPAGSRHALKVGRQTGPVWKEATYAVGTDLAVSSRPVPRPLGQSKVIVDRSGHRWLLLLETANALRVWREVRGQWVPDAVISPPGPQLFHGFDGVFDRRGRMHVVYAPWPGNAAQQTIRYRLRESNGRWHQEQVLPAAQGRNMTHPSVRMVAGRAFVVATGQVRGRVGGPLALFLITEPDPGLARFAAPIHIVDTSDFQHWSSRPEPHASELVVAGRTRDGLYIYRHTAAGRGRLSRAGAPTINAYTSDSSPRGSLRLARDGTAYVLVAIDGHLVLVRQRGGVNAGIEARLFARAHHPLGRVRTPIFELEDGDRTIRAGWITATEANESFRLLGARAVVSGGWSPLPRVAAANPAGSGLPRSTRWQLADTLWSRHQQGTAPRSIATLVWLVANVDGYIVSNKAYARLVTLQQQGHNVARWVR